jgi:hypothetical protein
MKSTSGGKSTYLAPYGRAFLEDHPRCRRNVFRNTARSCLDAPKLLLRLAVGRLKKAPVNLLGTDITEAMVVASPVDLEQTRANSIHTRTRRLVAIRRLLAYIGEKRPTLLGHCHTILTVPT